MVRGYYLRHMTPEELFDHVGTSLPGTKRSNMFGVTCYKIGRKPFINFHDGEIVCKLFDEVKEQALSIKGVSFFTPMDPDKPMKNWVQIPFSAGDQWAFFAEASLAFVEAGR